MTTQLVQQATQAIEDYSRAADQYTRHADLEALFEEQRTAVKQGAIQRLMAEVNPLTGNPHSASSAEKVVELDPAYSKHLQLQRETVASKNLWSSRMVAYQLTAQLRITQLAVSRSVVQMGDLRLEGKAAEVDPIQVALQVLRSHDMNEEAETLQRKEAGR